MGVGKTPQRLVSARLVPSTLPRSPMSGSTQHPPRPPRHESAMLIAIAVLIATVLTLAWAGVTLLAQRLQQGGG